MGARNTRPADSAALPVAVSLVSADLPEVALSERYRLGRLLDEGPASRVHLAHDALLGRDVAVKVLRGLDQTGVRRAVRAAQAAARVEDPRLMTVLDVDTGTTPFVVLAVCAGRPLPQVRQWLTPESAVDVLQDVLAALAVLHAAELVHRDVCADNVCIEETGRAVLTSAGLAEAAVDPGLGLQLSDTRPRRTRPAPSPEQELWLACDTRSDVHAAGVLLHELLPEPSEPVRAVIRRATAEDPRERQLDGHELAEAFAAALAIPPPPPPGPTRGGKLAPPLKPTPPARPTTAPAGATAVAGPAAAPPGAGVTPPPPGTSVAGVPVAGGGTAGAPVAPGRPSSGAPVAPAGYAKGDAVAGGRAGREGEAPVGGGSQPFSGHGPVLVGRTRGRQRLLVAVMVAALALAALGVVALLRDGGPGEPGAASAQMPGLGDAAADREADGRPTLTQILDAARTDPAALGTAGGEVVGRLEELADRTGEDRAAAAAELYGAARVAKATGALTAIAADDLAAALRPELTNQGVAALVARDPGSEAAALAERLTALGPDPQPAATAQLAATVAAAARNQALAPAAAMAAADLLVPPETGAAVEVAARDIGVPGTQAFTDTGIDLPAGAVVAITASGEVFHNPGSSTGPAGAAGPPEFNLLTTARHASVIGRVGDGEPFPVGAEAVVPVTDAGRLFLGINDAGVENNTGAYVAHVRVSSP